MTEVAPNYNYEHEEASTDAPELDLFRDLGWKITGRKGEYEPNQDESREQRIADIESDHAGIKSIEITMYALEISGKVRSRVQAEEGMDSLLDDISPQQRQQAVEAEYLAARVQRKVEETYEVAQVIANNYSALVKLREITQDFTPSNTAALKALESLESKNHIGPVTKRISESIFRIMIAEQTGKTDQIPSPLQAVQ